MSVQDAGPTSRSRHARLADAAVTRLLHLRPTRTDYTVEHALRVPMRDGIDLIADHYAPTGPAHGTLLMRTPYGRGALPPLTLLFARPFALAGYHVVVQSCRGTFGSGGAFDPFRREVDDGADTVAWLRRQEWFQGRFATIGPSYLGYTQWALLMDPPPEMATAVVMVGLHDPADAMYGTGAFTLSNMLGWTEAMAHQGETGPARGLYAQLTAPRRLAPTFAEVPLALAGDRVLGGKAPWYSQWLAHPTCSDPFWQPVCLSEALDRAAVPVRLFGGWQDVFLDQTLEQYARLRYRNLDVMMTIGSWTHTDMLTKAAPIVVAESLDWLAEHLAGTSGGRCPAPVRIFVRGANQWRDLADWPPAMGEHVLFLRAGGRLDVDPPPSDDLPSAFTYDPTHPTPTVGGPMFFNAGYRDDSKLAARGDVLTFTGPQLTRPLEVIGVPAVELVHHSDTAHADLFVRLDEVTPKGKSHNVTEAYRRLDPAAPGGLLRLELDAVAHRFAAGNRVRVLIAGGSLPHYDRNCGAGEPAATAQTMAPSSRTIAHGKGGFSRLILPAPATKSPSGAVQTSEGPQTHSPQS